ncbi:DUF1028 domain-containing protein [Halalkalibacillus halophilus]|uniref:DUF1028 domain-containing protein n=1 Tax=Halalkalibacillus halophilus TaxID=392827 RepID=UPI000423D518|nr:DUF1028 domain-containing protein [Halalkalibacillus halophilus]
MGKTPDNLVATFSIIGHDPETGELGIAVQSKFLGVGAVVPWAKAGVGAVATQSMANMAYGPDGLELLKNGKSAQETLDELVKEDPDKAMRQAGVVDAHGRSATFTGENCYSWAGGETGDHFAAQGNILVSEATVDVMASTFKQTEGTPLAERLIQSLQSGQKAGGDSRGMQSAALLVVKENAGYGGNNDRMIDLRVDEHISPIDELERIYHLHQLYFTQTKPENILEIDHTMKLALIEKLASTGFLDTTSEVEEEDFYQALRSYIHSENFETREQIRGKIDRQLYDYMTKQA